jgi:hypothetical protein
MVLSISTYNSWHLHWGTVTMVLSISTYNSWYLYWGTVTMVRFSDIYLPTFILRHSHLIPVVIISWRGVRISQHTTWEFLKAEQERSATLVIYIVQYYCIYSPISHFAYKSVDLFKVNLEVFTADPPISRYNFLPELANNFRSMFCCLYWLQIKIF